MESVRLILQRVFLFYCWSSLEGVTTREAFKSLKVLNVDTILLQIKNPVKTGLLIEFTQEK